MEDKIISAVRTFASSINSGGKVVADISELVDVTSQLPLSSFDYWERIIRSEFSSAIRESILPKWKVWSKPKELVTWLDLISWDGYKRENALRALSGAAPNTFFFLLRFVDSTIGFPKFVKPQGKNYLKSQGRLILNM